MPKPPKKPITADKPGIMLLALKRPDRPTVIAEKPVKDEVISLPTEEELVSDDATFPLPLPEKPSIPVKNHTESEQPTDNIDFGAEPNTDPLAGTQILVIAPWGGKTLVKIVGSYVKPGGDKWVSFRPISKCPPGWNWEGGVKLLKSI